jgi:hypothetical protein
MDRRDGDPGRERARQGGCDGNPVLGRIKLDYCGEAEEHQLRLIG